MFGVNPFATPWPSLLLEFAFLLGLAALAWVLRTYPDQIIDLVQRNTGLHVTDQQRASIKAAAQTAAGQIETMIDQGIMSVSEVHEDHPKLLSVVRSAMARNPEAVAGQAVTEPHLAQMVVGLVDTGSRVAAKPGAPAA
jgi:hypothetical protein